MSAQHSCFEVSITDRVAHIRFSRPERLNTFTPEAWIELPAIVKSIDRNARARCIVVSSSGKHFTAGMDLAVFTKPEGITSEEILARAPIVADLCKEFGYRYCDRLHIHLYGNTRGT